MFQNLLLQSNNAEEFFQIFAKNKQPNQYGLSSHKKENQDKLKNLRNNRRLRNKEKKRLIKQEEKQEKQKSDQTKLNNDLQQNYELEYIGIHRDQFEQIDENFIQIFEKFEEDNIKAKYLEQIKKSEEIQKKNEIQNDQNENKQNLIQTKIEQNISKKKKKQIQRISIFDLKMKSARPDLVENWDVTAPDPLFLIKIKQVRNTVPVPEHWSQKRRYLQYKRGIQKKPFKLPDFIENTGINKLRHKSDDANKSLKQRMRERIQPKMGKIEIDYNILHDAFFKHQKRQKLSKYGQIYYEGMENEVKKDNIKPGRLSPELLQALGIADNCPPPWILNMQRYGPPPAYPNLKIPGVNMPIPSHLQIKSDSFGEDDRGGLFKDEKGFTVYADCHGLKKQVYEKRVLQKKYWGEIDKDEQSNQSEIEDEDSSEEEIEDQIDIEDKIDQIANFKKDLDLNEAEFLDPNDFIEKKVINEAQSFEDLKSGISSLISGTATAIYGKINIMK